MTCTRQIKILTGRQKKLVEVDAAKFSSSEKTLELLRPYLPIMHLNDANYLSCVTCYAHGSVKTVLNFLTVDLHKILRHLEKQSVPVPRSSGPKKRRSSERSKWLPKVPKEKLQLNPALLFMEGQEQFYRREEYHPFLLWKKPLKRDITCC